VALAHAPLPIQHALIYAWTIAHLPMTRLGLVLSMAQWHMALLDSVGARGGSVWACSTDDPPASVVAPSPPPPLVGKSRPSDAQHARPCTTPHATNNTMGLIY
jgi:hypothetical protein